MRRRKGIRLLGWGLALCLLACGMQCKEKGEDGPPVVAVPGGDEEEKPAVERPVPLPMPPGPSPEKMARLKQIEIAKKAAEIKRLQEEAMKAAGEMKKQLLAEVKERLTELYNELKECCDELTTKAAELGEIVVEARRLVDETKQRVPGPARKAIEDTVGPLIPTKETLLEGFAIPSCADLPKLQDVLRQVDHPEEISSPANLEEIAKACGEARGKISRALIFGQMGLDALSKTLKHVEKQIGRILHYAESAYINLGHGRMDLVQECLKKIKAIDRREFGGMASSHINRCINAVLTNKGYSKLITQGYGECVRGYKEEGIDFITLARRKGAPSLLTSFLIKQCKKGADRNIKRCK